MSAVMKDQDASSMTVVLRMDDTIQKMITHSEGALTEASALVIDSSEMAQIASNERKDLANRIDNMKAARKKFVAPAEEIIENAKALFNPAIQALEGARELIGKGMLEWDRKERERIDAENRERESAERKARQEAAARAAAALARADEIAAAERRNAEEAETRRKQAEAEGNARAAAAAAADIAKANERAQAVQENAQIKASVAQVEVVAATPAAVAPVKITGSSVRENWVAQLKPGVTEDQAKAMIVAACPNNPQLLGLLDLNTSSINKMAKALKKVMDVPGYTAVNSPKLAGARK